jgi:hypothetical protein
MKYNENVEEASMCLCNDWNEEAMCDPLWREICLISLAISMVAQVNGLASCGSAEAEMQWHQ